MLAEQEVFLDCLRSRLELPVLLLNEFLQLLGLLLLQPYWINLVLAEEVQDFLTPLLWPCLLEEPVRVHHDAVIRLTVLRIGRILPLSALNLELLDLLRHVLLHIEHHLQQIPFLDCVVLRVYLRFLIGSLNVSLHL